MKDLLKIVYICQSYRKNENGTFFYLRGIMLISYIEVVLSINPRDSSE